MSTTCSVPGLTIPRSRFPVPEHDLPSPDNGLATTVFAGGCFWCVEAVFLALDGVQGVVSGYAGGDADSANYEAVCTGRTGHAEAVKIQYDPAVISYGELLRVFFSVAHDPTQLNRQGNDRGPQYRSAIFFSSPEEKRVAEDYIRRIDEAGVYPDPVATTLEPLDRFYPAEDYHQNFAGKHPQQPYIMAVAAPKLRKVREVFPDRLKQA
ncbi:peptide-methionine (S)-S-oxide reductase MsrA [Marinobacter sp. M1N3S26]|uniref:peptide-methionine (S)-S-oxide reductase MsrA n=1 Tax=unclassified Marinobacter TaxID=83889 RepID=UPI00387B1E40